METITSSGFGTYRLPGDVAFNATLYALNAGCVWIDTAPLYKNQEFIGNAIVASGRTRSSFKITTKISRDSLKNTNNASSIKQSFFESLRKLRVDYIDEVILHEPINSIKNWNKLVELYQNEARGLIGRIGVSNFNINDIKNIIVESKVVPSVNQIEVNPFISREKLVSYCRNNDIEIVAHSPLAKGEMLWNDRLIDIAHQISCNAGQVVTPAQVMLRWGIQQGYRVIPRSRHDGHIEENLTIYMDSFEIDKEIMQNISQLDCGYFTHPQYIGPDELCFSLKNT